MGRFQGCKTGILKHPLPPALCFPSPPFFLAVPPSLLPDRRDPCPRRSSKSAAAAAASPTTIGTESVPKSQELPCALRMQHRAPFSMAGTETTPRVASSDDRRRHCPRGPNLRRRGRRSRRGSDNVPRQAIPFVGLSRSHGKETLFSQRADLLMRPSLPARKQRPKNFGQTADRKTATLG